MCDVDGICRLQPLPRDAGASSPDAAVPDATSSCVDDRDCPADSFCNADRQCVAPRCDDRVRNGDETDIDCGGERCGPCGDGATCDDAADCASAICEDLRCVVAECGDGVTNGDEACDTEGATATCDADCTLPACNDGVFNPAAETCDTGGNSAECDADCTIPACNDDVFNPEAEACDTGGNSAECDAGCTFPACNDEVFNPAAEACDAFGETAECDADCTPVECGDGVVNEAANEQCDDSNATSGDGCSSECQFELAFAGFTTWAQTAGQHNDAQQDELIHAACAAAFSGSRGASMDELSSGTLPGLPATNTSGQHVVGTCPGCVGAPHSGCVEGHARNCVNPGAAFTPPFNDFCHTNASRGAACIFAP